MDATIGRVTVTVGALGTHIGICAAAPRVGLAAVVTELTLTVMVIITALYAPKALSDRAFRLIPWATKHGPENPSSELSDDSSSGQSQAQ